MVSQSTLERLQQRLLEQSFNILLPILTIVAALAVSSILIIAWGANVWQAYQALFSGAFGSSNAIATTLTYWVPLVLTGLAVTYAFRAGFFNIGMEGQLYLGALAGTWVALTFAQMPGWLLIPTAIAAAALAGGLLAVVPGILKAARGVNEVLSTLLLNYIVLQFFEWSIRTDKLMPGEGSGSWLNLFGLKDATQPYPQSANIPAAAQLPSLTGLLKSGPISGVLSGQAWYEYLASLPAYNRVTLAIVIATGIAILIYVILFKTTLGFQARAVGINPEAARRMGMNTRRTIILTAFISGALAGVAGGLDILGITHQVKPNFLVGAGFTGIPVALIAGLDPRGVLIGALFFAALRAGANKMQLITHVPIAVVGVIQALVILFVITAVAFDLTSKVQKAHMAKRLQMLHETQTTPKEVAHV